MDMCLITFDKNDRVMMFIDLMNMKKSVSIDDGIQLALNEIQKQ